MGRVIAIDFGLKRCGLAESDDRKIIASPLTTITPDQVIDYLEKYILKNNTDVIVVGEPKNLDGSDTDSSKSVNEFCKKLSGKFPQIKIEKADERFTSKMAMHSLIQSGARKKTRNNKGVIDQISAVLILQSYLERKD